MKSFTSDGYLSLKSLKKWSHTGYGISEFNSLNSDSMHIESLNAYGTSEFYSSLCWEFMHIESLIAYGISEFDSSLCI